VELTLPVELTVPVVREELVAKNRKFSQLAQAHDLVGTRQVLAELEDKGWANCYTYAAAVNALCRCSDWRGAEEALKRAEKKRIFKFGVGAGSGVIARTSMLRGYLENARNLPKARELLSRMEGEQNPMARPNTRTANTFLRGCLQLGAINAAKALLHRMEWRSKGSSETQESTHDKPEDRAEGKAKSEDKRESKSEATGEAKGEAEEGEGKTEGKSEDQGTAKVKGSGDHFFAPDASSYETVVALLSQALRYHEAQMLAKSALKQFGVSPGSAAMFVTIGRAAAVKGNTKILNQCMKRAQELLGREEQSSKVGSRSDTVGSGGKRGMVKWSEEGEGGGAARAKSLEVFQAHRRTELRAELREMEAFAKDKPKVNLTFLWRRTLLFEELETVDYSATGGGRRSRKFKNRVQRAKFAKETLAEKLCRHVSENFGLPEGNKANEIRAAFKKATVKRKGPERTIMVGDKAVKKRKVKMRIKPLALFEPDKQTKKLRPVHLEVCSGGGEWVCAQALRDHAACWLACELRFDRAARCFQRFALRGLASRHGNAGLVVGDAHDALQRRIYPSSCARLFVNHPEPPHQMDMQARTVLEGKENEAEGAPTVLASQHLLTVPFFCDACGSVLQSGGTLTICTDNIDYARFLLRTAASPAVSGVFEDALHGTPAAKERRVAHQGTVSLRAEPPPLEVCGAQYKGPDGASYFQRLKQSEMQSRRQRGREEDEEDRYFICLRRKPKKKQ